MNISNKIIQKQNDLYLENRDRIKEYQLKNHDKFMARKNIFF